MKLAALIVLVVVLAVACEPTDAEIQVMVDERVATAVAKIEVPAGERGEPGVAGPKGERGEVGPRGPAGARGVHGVAGEVGPIGLTGEAGPVGGQGERGEPGVRGDPGERGPQGERGPAGARGDVGPQGDPGPRGEKGDRGATGADAVIPAHLTLDSLTIEPGGSITVWSFNEQEYIKLSGPESTGVQGAPSIDWGVRVEGLKNRVGGDHYSVTSLTARGAASFEIPTGVKLDETGKVVEINYVRVYCIGPGSHGGGLACADNWVVGESGPTSTPTPTPTLELSERDPNQVIEVAAAAAMAENPIFRARRTQTLDDGGTEIFDAVFEYTGDPSAPFIAQGTHTTPSIGRIYEHDSTWHSTCLRQIAPVERHWLYYEHANWWKVGRNLEIFVPAIPLISSFLHDAEWRRAAYDDDVVILVTFIDLAGSEEGEKVVYYTSVDQEARIIVREEIMQWHPVEKSTPLSDTYYDYGAHERPVVHQSQEDCLSRNSAEE